MINLKLKLNAEVCVCVCVLYMRTHTKNLVGEMLEEEHKERRKEGMEGKNCRIRPLVVVGLC